MDQPLILLSGLPGTGKTRLGLELSRWLRLPLLAKDRFQSQLRLLGLAGREGADGYELLFDQADQHLSSGLGVILDAVFPKEGFRLRAEALAGRHGAYFRPILCYCSDEDLHKKRLEKREQLVPHWSPVGWDEVARVRGIFEPWTDESALRLDAADDFVSNLSRALDWIDNESGPG